MLRPLVYHALLPAFVTAQFLVLLVAATAHREGSVLHDWRQVLAYGNLTFDTGRKASLAYGWVLLMVGFVLAALIVLTAPGSLVQVLARTLEYVSRRRLCPLHPPCCPGMRGAHPSLHSMIHRSALARGRDEHSSVAVARYKDSMQGLEAEDGQTRSASAEALGVVERWRRRIHTTLLTGMALGLWLPGVLVALSSLACGVESGTKGDTSLWRTAYGNRAAEVFFGGNDACYVSTGHWATTSVAVFSAVVGVTAAVRMRLLATYDFSSARVLPGSTPRPLIAVWLLAWQATMATIGSLVMFLLPLAVLSFAVTVVQVALTAYNLRSAVTLVPWERHVGAMWSAAHTVLSATALWLTVQPVADVSAGEAVGTSLLLALAAGLAAGFTSAGFEWRLRAATLVDVQELQDQFWWLALRVVTLREMELSASSGSGVLELSEYAKRVSRHLEADINTGIHLMLRRHRGKALAGLYASILRRSQRKQGGAYWPELHGLELALSNEAGWDVSSFVLRRAAAIHGKLTVQQAGGNELAKAELLSALMRAVAACLGSLSLVWQALAERPGELDVDAVHEAAYRLYQSRKEAEGIMAFAEERKTLLSEDLLYVQAFYYRHILQVPFAAERSQARAEAMGRRAAFQSLTAAADGGEGFVGVSLSREDVRLYEEPPPRYLHSSFRSGTLLRGMYRGHSIRGQSAEGGADGASVFDYGMLLVDGGQDAFGMIEQANEYALHILAAGEQAVEVEGWHISRFLQPAVGQLASPRAMLAAAERGALSEHMNKPLLLPIVGASGSTQLVYASFTEAPPFVDPANLGRGSNPLRPMLMVFLLPVLVEEVASVRTLSVPRGVSGAAFQHSIGHVLTPLQVSGEHIAALSAALQRSLEGASWASATRSKQPLARSAWHRCPLRFSTGLIAVREVQMSLVCAKRENACATDVMLLLLSDVERAVAEARERLQASSMADVGEAVSPSPGASDSDGVDSAGAASGGRSDSDERGALAGLAGAASTRRRRGSMTTHGTKTSAGTSIVSANDAVYLRALQDYTAEVFTEGRLVRRFQYFLLFGLVALYVANLLTVPADPKSVSEELYYYNGLLGLSLSIPPSMLSTTASAEMWGVAPNASIDSVCVRNVSSPQQAFTVDTVAAWRESMAQLLTQLRVEDERLLASIGPNDSPRLTRADFAAAPLETGRNVSLSALGMLGFVVDALQRREAPTSTLRDSECAAWLPGSELVLALQDAFARSRSDYVRYAQSNLSGFVLNTVVIMSVAALFSTVVVVFLLYVGCGIRRNRRWILGALKQVSGDAAVAEQTELTRLYDSIVYHQQGSVEEDEEGLESSQPVVRGPGSATSGHLPGQAGSGSGPTGSAGTGSPPLRGVHGSPPMRGMAGSGVMGRLQSVGESRRLSSGIGGASPKRGLRTSSSVLFARSVVGKSPAGGQSVVVRTPTAGKGPAGGRGSVLSASVVGRRSVTTMTSATGARTRLSHEGEVFTLNMGAFRAGLEGAGGERAPPRKHAQAKTKRVTREGWRFPCCILALMMWGLTLIVINMGTVVGYSAWNYANVQSGPSRLFLAHRILGDIAGISRVASYATINATRPGEAATAVTRAVATLREDVRLLVDGGRVAHRAVSTWSGNSNDTLPLESTTLSGSLMLEDACTASVLDADVQHMLQSSALVIPFFAPEIATVRGQRLSPAHREHEATCGSVRRGIFRSGLRSVLMLYAAEALHVAGGLLGQSGCPPNLLPSANNATAMAAAGASPVQVAACRALRNDVENLVHLQQVHILASVERFIVLEAMDSLQLRTRWSAGVMAYSMTYMVLDVLFVVGTVTPIVWWLLSGLVASQLMLTNLSVSVRRTKRVQRRLDQMVQRVIRKEKSTVRLGIT